MTHEFSEFGMNFTNFRSTLPKNNFTKLPIGIPTYIRVCVCVGISPESDDVSAVYFVYLSSLHFIARTLGKIAFSRTRLRLEGTQERI